MLRPDEGYGRGQAVDQRNNLRAVGHARISAAIWRKD
jgi:hypothetical protein